MQGPGGPGGPPPPPSYTPQGFGRPAVQSNGIMRAAPPPAPSQQPQDPEALLEEKVPLATVLHCALMHLEPAMKSSTHLFCCRHANGSN